MPIINKSKDVLIHTSIQDGYKVYSAVLTQSGTNAPAQIIGRNTLGCNVTWTYVSPGVYKATTPTAFTVNKTHVYLGSNKVEGSTTNFSTRILNTSEILLESSEGNDEIDKLAIRIEIYI
jgi:hypothetical protein